MKKLISVILSAAISFSCIFVMPTISGSAASQNISDYQGTIDEMIILVNEARTEAGLNPVYAVPILNEAALTRSQECATLFSHTRPDGTLCFSILDDYSLSYYSAAENIAAGNATAEATFEQWKNSSGHWANIMDENLTHIGVGLYYQSNSTYGWYWTQVFIQTSSVEGQYIPERVERYTPGDVNNDNTVDAVDASLALGEYASSSVGSSSGLNWFQKQAAEVNDDNNVDAVDASLILGYYAYIATGGTISPEDYFGT